MDTTLSKSARVTPLAREIADESVRRWFEQLVDTVADIHCDVEVETTSVELQLSYRGEFLCRIVPYRQLFHVRVGEPPGWETRVRSETALLDTVDHILKRLLAIHASKTV